MEDTLTIPEEVQTQEHEQQDPPSKRLYDKLVSKQLYSKSYDEFSKQFSNPESISKLHTALVGKNLYSKGVDDFSNQFFSQKKNEVSNSPSKSLGTPSQLPSSDYHDLIKKPVVPIGQRVNEPSSTEVVQPKATASYDDFIAHNDEKVANRKEVKQKAIDKAAIDNLKNKGIIKPGEEGKPLDVHQFSELSSEKERLKQSLDNKDALISYNEHGEPNLVEKGKGSAGGYIWNKITDAIGGLSNAAGDITMQLLSKIPAARGDMSEQEILKSYRENIEPTLRTATTELVGADVSKEKEKDYNGQFLTHAAGSIASMIPAIGFPKGSGFVLQAFDGGLQNINNTEAGKNLSESTKTIFATGTGLVTGLLMKLNLDKIFGKETSQVASGIAANTITDLLKKSSEPITVDVFNAAIQGTVKSLKEKVISAGGKIGKGAITGGLFGASMEAANVAAEKITNKATGIDAFEPKSWGEEFGRVLNAGKDMAAVGGILGGIQVPFSTTRDYIKEKVGEAKNPEDIQALKQEMIGKVNEQVGGQDAGQQVSDLIDKYVDVYSKIPPEANNKSAIVDNIQERDDLGKHIEEQKQQLPNVDPAFQEPILKEINAAQGRVDEINKEISEKSQEPEKNEPTVTPTESIQSNEPTTQEQGVKETIPQSTEPVGNTRSDERTTFLGKSDAELEKMQSDLEDKMLNEKDFDKHQIISKEFSTVEKELEKREWDSVFKVPLEDATAVIDGLIKKEKERPGVGYGTFIEMKDARQSKNVIERYSEENKKLLSDQDIKDDFVEALMGKPASWYADGLQLRESAKEAANRGINIEDMLKIVENKFLKDGYDSKTAKEVIARYLEPVFKNSTKVETNENKLIESENKPIHNETAKAAEDTKPTAETGEPKEVVNQPIGETKPVEEETGDTTSIKNAVTDLRREQLSLNKADEPLKKDFATSWDEAKDKIDKGFNTQDLVDELKKKPRAINDVEDALLLHHQNKKEIELMDANDFINKASEKGNEGDLSEGKIRRARILDELQDTYNVNKGAGTETARGLNARKMMVDRKYNLATMMAEKRAANDGKPLTPEQEKDVEALHAKIKETQKKYDDYVKEAEAEIKDLQEKILGKKVFNKKSAADKLRQWADKLDEKTKGQAFSTIIPITPKMISGAMRLIADGLEKGGEVLDLIKKAIEEIKKSEPGIDESKLTKAINKEVIDSGITIPTSKESKKLKDLSGIALDRTALKLKAEAQRAKDTAEIKSKEVEAKNRTRFQKVQDTFVKWERAFKLSNPVTMGKLGAAAITRGITTPLEDIVGGGISLIAPKLSKGAIGEGGGLHVKELASAYKNGIIEGMKDAAKILSKKNQGKSDIDVVFGKGGHLPPEAIDFFGQLHSATKAPIKRAIFERQLDKRLRRTISSGVDVSDPLVQTQISLSAYKDANRAIFMQDNYLATGWQKLVSYFETVDKKTGKSPSKPIATAMQFLVPFVKVPTNIAAEIGTNVYGVPVGVGKILYHTFTNGMGKLSADEKDVIVRNLKKGTLGLAALSLGYMNPEIFGGYYQDKEHRKPEDAKAGAMKIGDTNIPVWLLESPIFQAMQVGATVRRVKDAKLKGQEKGITEGVIAGVLGIADHIPMIDQPSRILNAVKDPKERDYFVDELIKNTIEPSLLQKSAELLDDAEKRVPTNLKEHVEMGLPGLRENVPEKFINKYKFSDETEKFLKDKKIELPKTNFTYREEGKQIPMSKEQSADFNKYRNDFMDSEIKKMLLTKYDLNEENSQGVIVKSASVLGKDLDKYFDKEEGKSELQKKISEISKKATEAAKTKMGLEKQKNKVTVEEH